MKGLLNMISFISIIVGFCMLLGFCLLVPYGMQFGAAAVLFIGGIIIQIALLKQSK